VEGFETVKARLGPEVAASLQRKIAVRLRAALRASDLVASLGRDRYAVLLARIDVQADAERVAKKLVGAICQPVRVRTETVSVTARAGICHHPRDGETAEEMLRFALADADGAELGLQRGGFSNELETGWMPAANEDF
jgi:GGDEF domain-containing protein